MNTISKPQHPGRGGEVRTGPRGRQADPRSLAEIALLLGARPRRRDLLIEYLHLLQDFYGQISADHLAALAEELHIGLAEAYEVATFYAHFDVVKEDDPAVLPITIRICDSIACHLAGAEDLIKTLDISGVRILRAPCIGQCDQGPAAVCGQNVITRANTGNLRSTVQSKQTAAAPICKTDYETYRADRGYALFERLRVGEITPEQILTSLDHAGLRGMGGAGFPTVRKWRAVKNMGGKKYVIINADEGEPGTFKDRHILESDPHRMIEGALIAALSIGADEIFLYLRDEYAGLRIALEREIAKLPGHWPAIHLRRGAGAYICGEESALIESLEGKRGYPRQRPPLPFESGLFGRPTLTNNVETLYFIREIVEKGGDQWRAQGRHGASGLRHYSVSGRVRNPGVKLAPAGLTLQELLSEYCGGMAEGHKLYAYLPGGASGGILPASLANVPLDFGTLEKHGCFIGSAAIVIFSQEDDLKQVAHNLMDFFADESCGQCTPCRVGTAKAARLMQEQNWDLALLSELSNVMQDASICGLGQAAPNPILSLMRHFPELFIQVTP